MSKEQENQLLTKREILFLKAFTACTLYPFGLLPISWRAAFGRFVGRCVLRFSKREPLITELQLKWRMPELDSKKYTKLVYEHFGEVIFESLNLDCVINNLDKYVICENEQLPKTVKDLNRPVIALTAHMGNWELMAAYMVKVGVPLMTVGRQAKNRFVQYLLADIRARYGVKTMWKEDRAGLREMVKALTPGHTIAALIDQDTHVRSNNYDFMGIPAKTSIGLIEIGKRNDALFVTSFIVKEHGKYVIHVEEIPDGLSLDEIIKVYHERLEKLVRAYPEQWAWLHKRWRSGVIPNKSLSSREYIQYLKEQTQ